VRACGVGSYFSNIQTVPTILLFYDDTGQEDIFLIKLVCFIFSLPLNPDGVTINTRYMPTLGNGYLGLTVYDNSLFVNGIYSGTGGRCCCKYLVLYYLK
jgi:hypothetical protein